MNILNSYKRTRFFLWVNITGLAIGLATSIMLILFEVNELSYDRHFANCDRIVRLLTVSEKEGVVDYSSICIRKAYTELPDQAPGIETAVQVYNAGYYELTADQKRFSNMECLLADPGFFQVFQTKFIVGNPETSLASPNAAVITRKKAEIIFGSPEAAMDKPVSFLGINYVISGVVEEFPPNTHFHFDLVAAMASVPILSQADGLEFHTYYLIKEGVSVENTRADIETVYRSLIKPWGDHISGQKAYGQTEMLRDVHLKSKSATGSMAYIYILSALSLFVLLLAVTNFINLFVTQGETRMKEIGIRKTNGAHIQDIVFQFFSEVVEIVGIAFVCGFFIAIVCIPYFGELIHKNIDLMQLFNPAFIIAIILLFILIVVLSAFYPAIYLSRFSPLEILGKRIKFAKRRLTAVIVIFQSVISIVLLTVILILYQQTSYLEKLPLGYNPNQVMVITETGTIGSKFKDVQQELLKYPEVKAVAGSQHIFGGSCSGEVIAPYGEDNKSISINSYRVSTGLPELMELELVEGRFWDENDPDSVQILILNESAVKKLGGESPIGKTYVYNKHAIVTGVVKDFYYDDPILSIEPIAISRNSYPQFFNIRFNENVNRIQAQKITEHVFHQFDPDFILNPIWSTDIYTGKFKEIKTYTRIVLIGSSMSLFIAMIGLLAIHLFTVTRRTKEIGLRRIHGAKKETIFIILSLDVLKWIGIAAIIAIPIALYFLSELLNYYANSVSLHWTVIVLPVLIQCLIAIITTSGVSIHVLSQNPVKALKSE
jgi:putative ABC transport system permease protein